MKKILTVSLILFIFLIVMFPAIFVRGQSTSAQLATGAAQFAGWDSMNVERAKLYALIQLAAAGGTTLTVNQLVTNIPGYAVLSERDIQAAQLWVLNQLQSIGSSGSATNLTPWTSDINAATHSLTNAGAVSATTLVGALTGNASTATYATTAGTATNLYGSNIVGAVSYATTAGTATNVAAGSITLSGTLTVTNATGTNMLLGTNYFGGTAASPTMITAGDRIGILTNNPRATLDIKSSQTGSDVQVLALRSNPGGNNQNQFIMDNSQGAGNFKNQISLRSENTEKWSFGNDYDGNGTQSFFFWDAVGNKARLFISSSGNVGIGTTTPTNGTLEVNGTVAATGVKIGATLTNVISDAGSAISGVGITNGNVTIPGTLTATNVALTSVTNWGTVGRTNFTYTDSTGWWNTNNSAAAQGVNIKKGAVTADGTITASGVITAPCYDVSTNLWTIGTFPLGTNLYYTVGASTVGISGVGNLPTSTERCGQLTIKATGDITFTNLSGIATSDFVNTRTITNGNFAVVALDVYPGIVTNMAIAQFKAQ
jgi:hypothetical protein